MQKYLLVLIGLVNVSSTLAQSNYIDSLRTQLEFHKGEDTSRVTILNNLSNQYQHIDFHKSLNYAEQARRMAKQLSFEKGIAIANYRKAHCYWALGDVELSIEKALLAVEIAEQEKLTDVLAESFRILAIGYRDQQGIDKATIYINQAEKLALSTKNWDLLSRVYNTAGLIEFDKKKFDSSLILFNKALMVTEQHNTSKFQVCQIFSNIGECNIESNPDLAFTYFSKALAMAKQINNRQAEAGILCDLGRALVKKNRYEDANKYLLTGLHLSQELGLKRVTRHAYLALVDLKVREGNSSESFKYMKNYYDVRDSILNASKTRHIVELETSHEAERKEQTIKLLEQEKHIQKIWKNFLIAGAILLMVALVIIYRLQQLRNRKAKLFLVTQKKLNSHLKETDQLKSRFFANISHEFRTPLSLILAPIEDKINSPSTSEADKEDLKLVKRNADRLMELVNQLLDLSKLEVGKMQLHLREADLGEFISVLVASFDSLAEIKGIHFFKNVVAPSFSVLFDADKLEKIINNVLSNSFKFTPTGGTVTLSIYATPDGNSLKIKIGDTGKGMSEEEQSHIFTPFYQSKNTVEDGQIGSGLGLSLVHELVRLHRGEISLTSRVNEGTTIDISLPIHKGESETKVSIATSHNSNGITESKEKQVEVMNEVHHDSILIVEDNPDLRNYIASSFKNQFTIYTGKDGEEGLALAIEHIPNLIISDVMMPNMDGVVLVERIKSDERTSHIPVVLLTAKTDSSSRIQGYKTGADDYLSKPFSTEELRVRVANLIEQRKKLAAKFMERFEQQEIVLKKEPSLDEKFIQKAKGIVEANISNGGFGVEKMADEMCLSRAQLFRKFKALINTSPSDFLNDIRLQRAAELIRTKSDTLTQISYSVGFNEQSYFAKRFRKKFGVSPSEYANAEGISK